MINKQTLTIILIIAGILFLPSIFTTYNVNSASAFANRVGDSTGTSTGYTFEYDEARASSETTADDGSHTQYFSPCCTALYGAKIGFLLTETPSSVTSLNVSFNGFSATYGTPTLLTGYIWNYDTTSWESYGSYTGGSDGDINNVFETDVINYISEAGQVTFLWASSGPPAGSILYADLIQLDVEFIEATASEENTTSEEIFSQTKSAKTYFAGSSQNFFQWLRGVIIDLYSTLL